MTAEGYKCTGAMVYDVLMKVASENISNDAACRDLDRSASGNRIREVLNEQLSIESLYQYEGQINQALRARIPQQLQCGRVQAAIDEHDEPFYGKTEAVKAFTCRRKPKAGTSRFFRIVSLYVIYRQMRLTLAVAFVRPEEKTVALVQRLLHSVRKLKFRFVSCGGFVSRRLHAIKRCVSSCLGLP